MKMWRKNSWVREEDGGEEARDESEGENCRLYIYSGKNCSERIDDLEVEKGRKRERERREEEKTEKKKQKKNIRLTEQPSVTVGRRARRGSPRGAESSGE